jgi:protein-L-isoaspartate(D-aspartate) O-methyltransferase
MPRRAAAIEEARARYAETITRAAWVTDPRIERAFAMIPREGFLPPPPWTVFPPGGLFKRPTTNPKDLYDDLLVVLDARRGVNNGQPSLHAAWMAAVDPRPGEAVVHIGAGSGYYTAILSVLVLPGGMVRAYEIDSSLAAVAARNLACLDHVTLEGTTAIGRSLPPADVIYVNAAVAAPDAEWLRALKAGGRLIFPWQPSGPGGVTLLVTRMMGGFRAVATLSVGFVTCEGAVSAERGPLPSTDAVERTRSIWLTEDRTPDASATAIYDEVWFSADETPA